MDIGWESYGKLNVNKDNVILIIYYFFGIFYVVGKYKVDDVLLGYWDVIIGLGKVIDINKYYVISLDILVNVNWYDLNVIIIGFVLINLKIGKLYGLDFFVVMIIDFVNV